MVFLFVVVIWCLGIAGWIMNIYKLVKHGVLDFESVIRIIGIFVAPLGAVFGYF